ncbi:Fe(3+) ABC transporter substrate-binding protein [Profundibacter sp.]|uniref:Fe(3+) ABC transporter substrate-binding protein n=1 Tax=Profundibacter sp. TaxID=3101071 RepID=UPI003D0DD436
MFKTLRTALLASLALTTPALAEVNIYSYRQPELIQPLMDRFTQETGIPVNIAFLKKGMIEKLRAEGKRSPADLIFTVDIARLSAVVNADLTQPVTSDTLTANIPADLRDPDNQWFGLTTRARVVFASKDRAPEGVATYDELADPKWNGRICTRSGTHAYTVALVSAAIYHMGEEGAKTWLQGVKANLARKPQGNDRAQVKAVWAGECDIALGNTYYMGKMLNNPEQVPWAESVNVVFPVFKNGGTHVNVSGMALAKFAPHRDDAIRLMEFLASPEAQEIYAEQNFEYPVAPGTKPSELVASWGTFTPDPVNLMEIAKLRPAALRIIQEVDFDG